MREATQMTSRYHTPSIIATLGAVLLAAITVSTLPALAAPSVSGTHCSPAPCAASGGLALFVSRVSRDWPNGSPRQYVQPDRGFHLVRLLVTYVDRSGFHEVFPGADLQLQDSLGGQSVPDEGYGRACNTAAGAALSPGQRIGPTPLCFEAAGSPSGRLTLVWMTNYTFISVPLPEAASGSAPLPSANPTARPGRRVRPGGKATNAVHTDPHTGMQLAIDNVNVDLHGDTFTAPGPGKKFVLFYVTVHNGGTRVHPFDSWDLQVVTAGDQTYDPVYPPDRYASIDYVSLRPRETRRGWVAFEIPSRVRSLTVTWDDDAALNPPADIGRYRLNK